MEAITTVNSPWQKSQRHSAGEASPQTALLLLQIWPDILSRRALSAGRLAALGAHRDFHHGLLTVAVLKGRLVDESGRPVPSGTVYFISGPVALPDIAQLAGTDGEFVLSVPVPGRYRIGARAPGFAPGEADVDVSSDEARVDVTLKREKSAA